MKSNKKHYYELITVKNGEISSLALVLIEKNKSADVMLFKKARLD